MAAPKLTEIRLESFKSFSQAVLPVDPIIVITGRNSSGKSNALDGIEVLSRLASGEELADALDGRRREGGPVRGGSRGCAPHGTDSFSLGCTVDAGGKKYQLDVTIQSEPELRIIYERLQGPGPDSSSQRDLFHTVPFFDKDAPETPTRILAALHYDESGLISSTGFHDTRLLTSQLALRFTPDDPIHGVAVEGAQAITAALRAVFHLDPIPHLMRDYAPDRDSDLRRTGENISPAIGRLAREGDPAFTQLEGLVRDVADERIRGISVTSSPLGDVMMTLEEGTAEQPELTPAREMSDGLLRFMAVATALLTANRGLDLDPSLSVEGPTAGVLLVIEELENGLHPSQAGRVLRLIREASEELSTQVMLTTHSPALLNAMTGPLNRSVLVCYRDADTGQSQLTRLPDIPGYAEAMAAGRLGDVVSNGALTRPANGDRDFSTLNRLLGID